MITFSNRAVFPKDHSDYTGEAPSLEDIGRGLGSIFRFGGQTKTKWSVLTHTIVCASIVEPEHGVHALLHDAAESIVADVVTTWKHDETKLDEAEILSLIYAEHGLDWPDDDAKHAVDQADAACLAAEAHALGHARSEEYWPKDQFGDLETRAFDLTIYLLQQNAPMAFLDGVKAGQVYKQMVEQAIDPEGFEERSKIRAMLK